MTRRWQILYIVASLVFFCRFWRRFLRAGDAEEQSRLNARDRGVHDIIKKNYDPSLKGIWSWDKELHETRENLGVVTARRMLAAIYWMVRKMDDSHANFCSSWQTLQLHALVSGQAFLVTRCVYKVKEKGPAERPVC